MGGWIFLLLPPPPPPPPPPYLPVIVGVVGRGDLHRTGTKGHIDEDVVSHDGNLPTVEWVEEKLPVQVGVAVVSRGREGGLNEYCRLGLGGWVGGWERREEASRGS